MSKYIEANAESGKEFYQRFHNRGKVVMLNLLRYKAKADYSGHESLMPSEEITGKGAYQLYMKYTLPELEKAGSKVLFFGTSHGFLIGPEAEKWDAVILVEHQSVEKFIAFSQSEGYKKTAGHRTAALDDSRLLPINQKPTTN